MSAYFEPYLHMLKVQSLITVILHVGERQTLDHKVVGFDSHLGHDVVSLSKALIPVA